MNNIGPIKRPHLITALAVLQYVVATVYLVGAYKIISLIYSEDTQKSKDAANAMFGLNAGAIACAVWMILSYVSARGLWKMKNWARWLALASNGFIALTLIYSNYDDYRNHSFDHEDLIATCLFIIPVIPFLLPAVGRCMKTAEPSLVSNDLSASASPR